ncbi:nuclear transport factor 2 family protein [Rhizobium sp.]|uniref:nuclear transport factor 2 family protein n=1 Tax=Rhizobium sp. TaxID=391 RepID=UPI0028ACDD72
MALLTSERHFQHTQMDPMPPLIRSFFSALNAGDIEGLLGHFTSNTVINDQMLELTGERDLRRWAERDVVGLDMKAEILSVRARKTGAIVSAKVTGNFDAPGLPEPLVLLFYSVVGVEGIEQLIILRADF